MPKHPDNNEDPALDLPPSKSELKRRMLALQELGETLVELNNKQLQQIPITDERLLQAVRETRQIRSNSARRRHMQYIGKLMRDLDATPIERALQQMHQSRQQENDGFHQLEKLRDAMLEAGIAGVELAMQRWPQADRQHLRQLLLQHQREVQNQKPPAASRKLFRYLREQQENYGGEEPTA